MNLSKDKVTEIFYFADNFCKEFYKCRLNIIMQHRCAKIRRKFVSGRKSSKVFWVCG